MTREATIERMRELAKELVETALEYQPNETCLGLLYNREMGRIYLWNSHFRNSDVEEIEEHIKL